MHLQTKNAVPTPPTFYGDSPADRDFARSLYKIAIASIYEVQIE